MVDKVRRGHRVIDIDVAVVDGYGSLVIDADMAIVDRHCNLVVDVDGAMVDDKVGGWPCR